MTTLISESRFISIRAKFHYLMWTSLCESKFPQCKWNAPWAGCVPGTAGLWGRGTSRRASERHTSWYGRLLGGLQRKPALTPLALTDLHSPAPDSHADLRTDRGGPLHDQNINVKMKSYPFSFLLCLSFLGRFRACWCLKCIPGY